MNLPYRQVVAEYNGDGSLIADYAFGLDRICMRREGNTYTYASDGQGSIRQITNSAGTVTDTYDYYAFGEVLNRTGTTQNEFTYTGEQWDPNAGFYYLRARWYNPENGLFVSRDPWSGDLQTPISLHRYVYANASPVNLWDPNGWFSQSFGYAVEDEVDVQYEASHPGDDVSYGKWCRVGANPRLKPDIFNKSKLLFNEIKPLSFMGIGSGLIQFAVYSEMFNDERYSPDVTWKPSAAIVQNIPVWFVNFQGILFYTDIEQFSIEALVATFATMLYKAASSAKSLATVTSDIGRIRALISF
jgi:RHS repeat-associated protein